MTDYKFYAFFTATKQGKIGLTPAVDVYDSSGNLEVNNGVSTELGGGLYIYVHSTAIPDDYVAIFKTADATVDAQHIPSLATKQLTELPANIWNEDVTTYAVPGTAGNFVSRIPTMGTGSVSWDYYVKEPDLVTPIPDVTVRVSTDLAGLNTVAMGTTDNFGKITFNLDPGTYYFWSYKVYYSFTNPDTEVVS